MILDSCAYKETTQLQYSYCSNMVVTNFTGEDNQKTIEQLYCSAELTVKVHTPLTFLSVINIFLSITAFLGNALILAALRKESSLHPPSKLLYRNLAITDLCVGIIVEPVTATYWIAKVIQRWDICRYALILTHITGYSLCGVSLFTTTVLSVDRLLALLLGLRYRQVVTLKRIYEALSVFWALSIIGTTLYFSNPLLPLWCANISISLCLVISVFCYTKIFFSLRRNQIQVQGHVSQGQPSQAIPLNIARYKKAVYSVLWIQVTLVVCYLPYVIAVVLTPQGRIPLSVYLARQFTITLVYLNSSLNPLLYCWKIREVRQAVKDTLRELCN